MRRVPRFILRGSLDRPTGIIVPRSKVLFSGWALAGTRPPHAVDVVINGGAPIHASMSGDRPDVAAAVGSAEAGRGCAWSAIIDLTNQPAGEVRVQIVAYSEGMWRRVVANRVFMLTSAGIKGFLDVPKEGDTIFGDLLVVRGWSWSPSDVATVEIDLDGTILGRARLGIRRPDVHAHEPATFGPATGWEFRGIVPHLPDGTDHLLSAHVTDMRGVRAEIGTKRIRFQDRVLSIEERAAAERWQRRTTEALARVSVGRGRRQLLVFTHSLDLGGGQLYLQDLLRELAPRLESCRVISPTAGLLAEELERSGIDVVVSGIGMPYDVATYEGAVFQLGMMIKASGCTSVILNTVGQFVAADAAERAGVPSIWAIHESFVLSDWLQINFGDRPVHPYIRQRLEAALVNASRVLFEADATREIYLRAGVPAQSTRVLAYGIDIDAIDAFADEADRGALRERNGIRPEQVVLLCVGVFEERKGQVWLVSAFAKAAEAHPNAILVLVGDHQSPYAAAVHEVIDAMGLRDRVRTVPITKDIWDWYVLCDLLISCSDVESLPRSMLEAMAFGRGVLAAASWGIPELITEGRTGWLVRPRDTAALVAGIHRVLALDAADRRQICDASRQLVRATYRTDGYVSAYLDLVDELELQDSSAATRHRS